MTEFETLKRDLRDLAAMPDDYRARYVRDQQIPERIRALFRQGQTLVIEKGAVVRSMNPQHREPRVLPRQQTVTVRVMCEYGHEPTISWAGSGGYWQDCPIRYVKEIVS